MSAGFSIEIKASAQREMDALTGPIFTRIDKKILALSLNPRPRGCRKLRGQKDVWRIRIGDYRVLYSIQETRKLVSVLRVAHRREVYE
ncbi:MAG: type II toxin-antitoxin system RelE family toxin [Bryobacteraceae bacterium]